MLKDIMCDALPDLESDSTSTKIILTDWFGKMNKHKLWLDSENTPKTLTLATGTELN